PAWSTTVYQEVGGGSTSAYIQIGGGMRFTNITVPQGAAIGTAYLTLHCYGTKSTMVVNSKISAEDVDNAPTFTTGDAFDASFNNHTLARINWDNIPAWTTKQDYDSPEIKTVIKEIVDREDWASGHAIVIFWEDFDDRSTHAAGCTRRAYSYDYSTTYAPKLVIDYTVPVVAPTVTTQAVTDIDTETATGHGNITDNGGENCSKRGVCWNTTGNPTVDDSKSGEEGSFGTGAFTRPMTGLNPGQHYYVKAYA
ncbi:unnamed protein product, partial [marine sediment metagenome]